MLNYNFTEVKNIELVKKESGITEALIWGTMAIGMREITEANHEEFYKRIHMVEETRGTWTTQGGKPKFITLQDVENRIGLYTNASTFSRRQLEKNLAKK